VGNWVLSGLFGTYKSVFKLKLEFNTRIVLCLLMADALYNIGTTPSVHTVRFAISTHFSGQVRKVMFRTHLGSTLYAALRLENGVGIWRTGLRNDYHNNIRLLIIMLTNCFPLFASKLTNCLFNGEADSYNRC
jgi:hypothetical protein